MHKNIPGLTSLFVISGALNAVTASDSIIAVQTSGTYSSNLGTEWRLVTDQVMGGVSVGELALENYRGRECLRLVGDVSTENNGGFIQMALPLTTQDNFDASAYTGIEIDVAGNTESYNIHIRTTGLWFPWQSYRFSFQATTDWQTLRFPFSEIKPYKTNKRFQRHKLVRIGLVGIGREFKPDLCVASVKLYKE